ncbi:hypothetical protein Mterra_04066 [Calidithermus terrae]|uniref:Uncharacterized protein n=1 Tax=Calidithermus terrae TaxID=1408545 RepID=A0A399DW70_9DEIN|nr:hypothetical protein Mterra_04066 [Calidithermus terrae]
MSRGTPLRDSCSVEEITPPSTALWPEVRSTLEVSCCLGMTVALLGPLEGALPRLMLTASWILPPGITAGVSLSSRPNSTLCSPAVPPFEPEEDSGISKLPPESRFTLSPLLTVKRLSMSERLLPALCRALRVALSLSRLPAPTSIPSPAAPLPGSALRVKGPSAASRATRTSSPWPLVICSTRTCRSTWGTGRSSSPTSRSMASTAAAGPRSSTVLVRSSAARSTSFDSGSSLATSSSTPLALA